MEKTWAGVLVLGALFLGAVTPAPAQITVYSTFGLGGSYDTSRGWTLGNASIDEQQVAGSFRFSRHRSAPLHSFRVGLFNGSPPVFARFFEGPDLNTATELESFAPITPSPDIGTSSVYTFASLLHPVLTPGMIYWIALSVDPAAPGSGAWNQNSQGILGATFEIRGVPWTTNPAAPAPAFDVRVATTPEPSSLLVLGSGLLGVGAAARRRKRVTELAEG